MKRLKPWIIAVVAASLTLSVVAGASAQGQPPAAFTGTVTGPEGIVAGDLAVESFVGNGEESCNNGPGTTFQRIENNQVVTKYWVTVAHTSQKSGCGSEGAEVRFTVGGQAVTQTGTWSATSAVQTLNLTLAPEGPATVDIDVTVWQSLRTENIFVSTRPEGAGWTTFNTPIDLSQLSGSGNFYQGSAVTVAVDIGGGNSVNIDVTVWRSVRTGSHFVSTRPEGAGWTTFNTPIDLSQLSSSGNFYQGSPVTVTVDLE